MGVTYVRRVVVLGAGASRSVSYKTEVKYLSPLDTDFFDLLQRRLVNANSKQIREAITRVLDRVAGLPYEYWRSMERSFYTLHLRAYLAAHFTDIAQEDTEEAVIGDFAVAIQALLRFAHEKNACSYHEDLFKRLGVGDAIITFNYDLVPERALRGLLEQRNVPFGKWLYGLRLRLGEQYGPVLLKLHGSSNWNLKRGQISPVQQQWRDFEQSYGYRAYEGEGTSFPIFLPFWDKKIEQNPWLKLWRIAYGRLERASHVIVWGYSLPLTDVKAHQLFGLALAGANRARFSLCVIEPSEGVRLRWRALFPKALFWEYADMNAFRENPPHWWKLKGISKD